MRKVAKTFKALSDETRLRILNILLERECCVCELMQVLGITQSRTSRHLITLCDAGFLKFRRQGLWVMHSIDWENMDKYRIDLTDVLRGALKDNQVATIDRQKLAKTVRIGLTACATTGAVNEREN